MDVKHSSISLCIDPVQKLIEGSVTHRIVLSSILGRRASFKFRGGVILSISTHGQALPFTRVDPLSCAARAVPLAAGLEAFSAAANAAVSASVLRELSVNLPHNASAAVDGCIDVTICYRISGSNGALVFSTDDATGEPYVLTKLQPSSSDEWLGAGAGPRCIFPCVDSLSTRCTYDVRVTVAGTDEDGMLSLPAHGLPAETKRAQMHVACSGTHVNTSFIPPSTSAASWLEGSAWAHAGASSGSIPDEEKPRFAGRLEYTYHVPVPVVPSAIGLVIGPLVRFERVETGPVTAASSWMGQLGLIPSSSTGAVPSSSAAQGADGASATPHGLPPTPIDPRATPALLGPGARAGAGASSSSSSVSASAASAASSATPRVTSPPIGASVMHASSSAVGAAGDVVYFHSARRRDAEWDVQHHARRGRRMGSFLSEWLDAPLPTPTHAHVYVPESVLPCTSALHASPTGLAFPSSGGGNTPGYALNVTAALTFDTFPLLGLTLYPDALLTPLGVVDPEATSHRAQTVGMVTGWIGCIVGCASWEDYWLVTGLCGYVAAQYLRTLRGDDEYQLDVGRAAEAVARLEEQFPGISPLAPRPLATGHNPLTALSPQHRWYVANKAPAVIHMLAVRLGEDAVQRAIRLIVRYGMRLPTALAEVAASMRVGSSELQGAIGELKARAGGSNMSLAESSSPFGKQNASAASHAASSGAVATGGRLRADSFALELTSSLLTGGVGGDLLPVGSTAASSDGSQAEPGSGDGGSEGVNPRVSTSLLTPHVSDAPTPLRISRQRLAAAAVLFLEGSEGVLATDWWLALLQSCSSHRLPLPLPHSLDAAAPPLPPTSPSSPISPPLLCKPLETFSEEWIRDTGVPHLAVGLHVNRRTNVVELVVEQLVRPGVRVFTGELTLHIAERAEGDEGTVGHVGGGHHHHTAGHHHHHHHHGGGAPPPYAATPEVWSYAFPITTVRDVFFPPCHTKLKRRAASETAAAVLMPDTHRKKARESGGARVGKMDPLAQLQALAARDAVVGDSDNVNDTPVLWLRVDPAGGWLKRVTLAAPAVMAATQLVREESVGGRLEALACLAGLHSPYSLYNPGNNGRDVFEHRALPDIVWDTPRREDDSVCAALRRDTTPSIAHCGYLLRPHRRLYVPCRLLAVGLDVDPTHAGTGRERDALAAVLRGGDLSAVAMGGGGSAARRPSSKGGSKAEGASSSSSFSSSAAPLRVGLPVGFHFRVRCAAAVALAQWATSRLPPAACAPPSSGAGQALGDEDGPGAAASLPTPEAVVPEAYESFSGLAAVMVLVKRLLFAPDDAVPADFSLTDDDAAGVLWHPTTALPVLEAYAVKGTPCPPPITSLGDFEVRIAAVTALARVRHSDGATPLPALLLLTRLLRGYESGGGSRVLGALQGASLVPGAVTGSSRELDDGPLLAALVLGLGDAITDCLPPSHLPPAASKPSGIDAVALLAHSHHVSKRRAAMVNAHAALREAFALQLAALRQAAAPSTHGPGSLQPAPSQPRAAASAPSSGPSQPTPSCLAGTVAASCVTALAAVESTGCAPPATLPLLRNLLGRCNPSDGHPLPPRLRVAAFAALVRAFVVQPTAAASPQVCGESAASLGDACTREYYAAAAALIGSALQPLSNSACAPLEAAVAEQHALTLHLLHHRSDGEINPTEEEIELAEARAQEAVAAAAAAAASELEGGIGPDVHKSAPLLTISCSRLPPLDPLMRQLAENDLVGGFIPPVSSSPQDEVDGEAIVIDGGEEASSEPAVKRRRVAGGSTQPSAAVVGHMGHWHADDVLIDAGALDVTLDGFERLSVFERRLYGATRLAPSSLGALRHLNEPALADVPEESPERRAAGRVAHAVWAALAATAAAPAAHGPTAAPTLFHLFHGIWGMMPPPPVRVGPSTLPDAGARVLAQLGPLLTATSNARREHLRWRRDALRERHVAVSLLLCRSQELHEVTSAMMMMALAGEDGPGGGPDDAGIEEVVVGEGYGAEGEQHASVEAGFVEQQDGDDAVHVVEGGDGGGAAGASQAAVEQTIDDDGIEDL